MRVTAISVGLLMEIVRLNSDSNPAISIRAILLSKSDFNLVPWALVDGELALATYFCDSIQSPHHIHVRLKLIQREEAHRPQIKLNYDCTDCVNDDVKDYHSDKSL